MHSFTSTLAELPTLNINANEWTGVLASAVGPWIAGGLGVAVVILAVVLGWRKLRSVVDMNDEPDPDAWSLADQYEFANTEYQDEGSGI